MLTPPMMTNRENMLAALSGRTPERVPAWELEFNLWHKFTDKNYRVGNAFAALSAAEQAVQIEINAEVMCAVADELGFSGITIPPWYWEASPGEAAWSWLPEPARDALARRLLRLAEGRFLFVAFVGGVLGMPPAREYEEFCYLLLDDPAQIDRRARQRCDQAKEAVKRWSDLGAEGFLMPSDLATNRGPFYRPEQMERFIYPYLREMAETIAAHGGRSILHTDGDVLPLLRHFADCGVDAIQAIDPTAGMNLGKTKEAIGDRLCLCGNVDCATFLLGDPPQVAAATRECLRQGKPGGRFVLGASNVVEPAASAANFRAMMETLREDPGYFPPASTFFP